MNKLRMLLAATAATMEPVYSFDRRGNHVRKTEGDRKKSNHYTVDSPEVKRMSSK